MAFNKKADLAISTNAIVVLIIAVIMLGLIIGLVTRGFSAVEKKFLGQVENEEPPAPRASASQPITLSANAKIVSPGELVGMKVNVFNSGTTELAGGRPLVSCDLDGSGDQVIDTTTEQVRKQTIAVNTQASFTYIFKILDTASPGKYLCFMQAADDATPSSEIKVTEFTITVEE